ncbi:MAG TPA: hypothetical protein VMG58_09855 [Candidatus Sulfotelmatobacter sp.]|nr:hypothetical protein [Candidatus Sulfotelmatobacter sp.]
MANVRQDPHERAKRLARLIVADIVLYNKDKIAEGIRNDTLFEVLERELEDGRKYYDQNIDRRVALATDYFSLAVVDLLVKPRGDVESKIW